MERLAILLTLLSAAAFALQDAVMKAAAAEGSVWQVQFLRSLVVLALIVGFARVAGRGGLWPHRPFWPFVRAVVMSVSYVTYYAALPFLQLSEAAAGMFTAPIFTCILAALFLGERIGPFRIGAIVAGFAGALIVLRPGAEAFSPVLLAPIASAFAYSVAVVVTRARCRSEPSFSLTIVHNMLYSVLGCAGVLLVPFHPFGAAAEAAAPFLLTGWVPLTGALAAMILATSLSHIVGMTSSIAAYQRAEATRIAPLEYTYLVYAALIDRLLWGAVAGAHVWTGGALIVAAGVVIAIRSERPPRPLATNRTPR